MLNDVYFLHQNTKQQKQPEQQNKDTIITNLEVEINNSKFLEIKIFLNILINKNNLSGHAPNIL